MPEQTSRRSNNVTGAAFEAPFQTSIVRFGSGTLNLKDSLDAMDGWARHTNVWHEEEGEATARPGQTPLASHSGSNVHSIRKMRNPADGSVTRLWGVGSTVQRGASGGTSVVDSGYSGDPLALVPHRPPFSGEGWAFVGDKHKMAKIRVDGLALPIGLPAPAAQAQTRWPDNFGFGTMIAMCDDRDGTAAAAWTPVKGQDNHAKPTGVPTIADDTGGLSGTGSIYCVTVPGSVTAGYCSWWGCPVSRDLTVVTDAALGDTRPASDDDIMHVYFKLSHPAQIAEIRLYVVVSASFDPTRLPGTPPGPLPAVDPSSSSSSGASSGLSSSGALAMGGRSTVTSRPSRGSRTASALNGSTRDDGTAPVAYPNSDAYVKSFRPSDYVQFVQTQQPQITAAETARINALRDKDSQTRAFDDKRTSWANLRAQSDPGRATGFQLGLAAQQWFTYGMVGSPLRRGDFQRIGSTDGRDWSTVTGVILYVQTVDSWKKPVAIGMDDFFLTGGCGPDTTEPGAQMYDYRVTNYDPRTGAESNGSDEQDGDRTDSTAYQNAAIDSVRRPILVDPPAYGDPAIRQRIYRRGGSLYDDWYYCGTNDSDGGVFQDENADDEISAAGTLPTDRFQPVPTVNDAGDAVLAQPCRALWGPLAGMLFACGDPYRPGHVYYSVPDEPDHWSASGFVEVCSPSEELMNGGLSGNQAFVFSRERMYWLYPNLGGASGVASAPANCTRGLLDYWSFCVGPGGLIFFVSADGVFATDGGPETWLSEKINPMFYGVQVNGYAPIDKNASGSIRLTCWQNDLFVQYQDTTGARQVLVYSLLLKFWRHYRFAQTTATLQGEDEQVLLMGGQGSASYTHSGTSDAGAAITATIRTGSASGGSREEKLFGDLFVDADTEGVDISVQVFLNEETYADNAMVLSGPAGRQRFLVDTFGRAPQKAHSIATELSWTTGHTPPTLYQLGYAITLQPDITTARVTNWDDLSSPDEVYLTGVTLDCDTGGNTKTINVEIDIQGTKTVASNFQVTANGRHKFKFSWPAVQANLVRIAPDPDCTPWLLYRVDWIYQQEPPRISGWDIHFENSWDQYYTGLDLYCDTFGKEKDIQVYVDEQQLINPATGQNFWPIVADGRRVCHLTLPWGRGHVFRFVAVDPNPGLLYNHRWFLDHEPSEQANWNQNFSILGTRSDKWLKAVVFECDTFGQDKSVQVEVDGTVAETLTINTTGRTVVQRALSQQHLGRVWRMYPVDSNPGRLYSVEPIFDEEPFCLTRWETQETNHGIPGWFYPLYAHITLKSSADVTLTTILQVNQVGGTATNSYTIPATGGQKRRTFLPGFVAGKGVLIKYLLTSSAPFWLYRDETTVVIQPWGAYQSITVQPFGNDDLDPSRPMTHAVLAAESSGGIAQAAS